MQILCLAFLTLISGRVVDGKTGEPVALARVSIGDVSVVTGSDGTFILPDSALPLTLSVTAVGYATSRKTVRTTEDITIVLVAEGAELTENITVIADIFEGAERSLNKSELQSNSLVLVGDALRAAQALPGVVANNDLRADFAVRGASPDHVAVVLDGVLTDNFVHTFAGADSSERLSLSLISQDFNTVFGFFGNRDLKAERAVHYNLSAERAIGARTRVVVEMYDREETRGLFSFSEPHRNATGQLDYQANPFRNSLTGFARGADFMIQRRSANGLSGWVSYGFMRTRQHDAFSGLDFVSDADQQHTLNLSGSWRLKPTFSVSSQFRYGSGQPIPGFLRRIPGSFEFSSVRNTARLNDYSRMDIRASRSFPHASWKWTLSGEVLNVLHHKNEYNVNSNIVRFRATGLYFASIEKSFGVLASAGVYFEF
jgi:hypothetical protein